MKKLLTLTAVGAILTAPASAVQKCVAFDTTTPEFIVQESYGSYDWTGDLENMTIYGVAACGFDSVSDDGSSISTSVQASAIDIEDNTYCWCRMISPAISKWVYNDTEGYFDSAIECSLSCAYACTVAAGDYMHFRERLFNNLIQ